jgi:UDP-N-acetylmuramate dehydrogenase
MNPLYKQLQNFGHVRTNQSVAKFTTFQIGGIAQFLIEVTETQKLIEVLNFLTGEGINWFILGGGSNVLWQDEDYEGVVIKVQTSGIKVLDQVIEAEAGVPLSLVMNVALKQSWGGLEWAAGLPGTVGGAVRGNAGAMWSDTAHSIEKIEVWHEGEIMQLRPKNCGFAYRESIFKHSDDVVLKAWFSFVLGDKIKMMADIQDYLKKRAGKYPPLPSGGSFFKNIDCSKWSDIKGVLPEEFIKIGKIPAGWLIDKAGLKGLTMGGCMVSKEHGNFMVNFNNGTQQDILKLVEIVKQKVYDNYGIELEEEVKIVNC